MKPLNLSFTVITDAFVVLALDVALLLSSQRQTNSHPNSWDASYAQACTTIQLDYTAALITQSDS
eukprot:1801268-Amphidinium_carterae.1